LADSSNFSDVSPVFLAGGTLAYHDHELTLHRSGRPVLACKDTREIVDFLT
jgi:hypothetical protein